MVSTMTRMFIMLLGEGIDFVLADVGDDRFISISPT